MKLYIFFILFLFIQTIANCQTWTNPMTLAQEWPSYGIGDPYILKHRGVYYLYCSTRDHQIGVKVWSSRDLVEWNYEGFCSDDVITTGAYAPEVIYWNGTFYMYTSPAGNGHFALSSDSPTGPFLPISGNFGKSIDGTVFIDDDAGWYFYHASPSGIKGCVMTSPIDVGPSLDLNAVMNNTWTEGPTVFKRNGIYYLTYTGNHILSKGYRIDYASNINGPIASYNPANQQNPIIISTLNNHNGLGHGSVFIGPDLDSYYFTYHNLLTIHGPWRKFNYDRIAWNGEKLIVLGPTIFHQQAPEMPTKYDFFERDEIGNSWSMPLGGNWAIHNNEYFYQNVSNPEEQERFIAIMDSTANTDYTAEFNFREVEVYGENALIGAVFDYTDSENYGIAVINSQTNQLVIKYYSENVAIENHYVYLPYDADLTVWHNLRVEKKGEIAKFFFDGMHLETIQVLNGGGKIGYLSEKNHAHFDFIAFSNKVNGSGVYDIYKPVPGTIDAVLYNTGGQGKGFFKTNEALVEPNINREDGIPIVKSDRGGYALESIIEGEWLKYNLNIDSENEYNIAVTYSGTGSENKIRIWLDDLDLTGIVQMNDTGGFSKYRTFVIKDIVMPEGYHTIKLEVVSGNLNLYSYQFVLANNKEFDRFTDFATGFSIDWRYADGNWSIVDGMANINGTGKRTFGHLYWADYMVETNIKFLNSMNGGILLRVNNPALGGPGNSPELGTNFLQGYFVGFNFSSLVLAKQNYGWQLLTSSSGDYNQNNWYHLRAVIKGDLIQVFVDDMNTPVISYTDTVPFINGRAGLRSFNSNIQFDNFRVTSNTTPTSVFDKFHEGSLLESPVIFPNPASDRVTITLNGAIINQIQLFGIDGKENYKLLVDDTEIDIPINGLSSGIYIIRIYSNYKTYNKKLIIRD